MRLTLTPIYRFEAHQQLEIPLFLSPGVCGFPSPADDHLENSLDLNDLCILHPSSTFFLRASGSSMQPNINQGDVLVVDKALKAKSGDVIVALINGEFTVKRFEKRQGRLYLTAFNPNYPPLEISEEAEFQVWGVVTYVLHQMAARGGLR